MSRRLLVLGLVACLSACHPRPNDAEKAAAVAAAETAKQDALFAEISQKWLTDSMKLAPVSATQAGDHRYDALLDDMSAAGRASREATSRRLLDRLDQLDRSRLSRANQVDEAMLRNQLRADLWEAKTYQAWAWNPLLYSQIAGNSLYLLMARDFAPLPDRLRNATSRMEKLPKFFQQAHDNLSPNMRRVPRVHAETAARQAAGVLSIVDEMILPAADALSGDDRKRLDAAITGLRVAVKQYQEWLEKELVPGARGDFRVGAALFDQKLAFATNASLSRDDIKRRAEAELERVRNEMYTLSRSILAGKPGAPIYPANPTPEERRKGIAAALALAAADRPKRDGVIPAAEDALTRTTAFVREKDLLTLPDAPLQIIPLPPFQRGYAFASCDPPGPLDKGQPTFYTVSPIPDEWNAEQVDSFLREYNFRSIDELTVHEAMPGHFVQMWHANRYPSPLRAVLWSGPFVEGWAWYTQNVMVDMGYRGNDPLFKLVHLKWLLRGISNAIVDQMVHVDGASREDTVKFMVDTTFQEEREAAGKWTRAQLEAAQLSTYFVGAEEWIDLRRAAESRAGAAFNLKQYHDKVLSYGAPPVRFARALYFDEPIK